MFRVKRTVVIFLISIFIFFSPISHAFNDSQEQEEVKTFFEHLKKFSSERWSVVFTGAVIGGKLCGVLCIIPGGILAGVTDGLLTHLGYSDKYYLTRGMWGLTLGNKVNPFDPNELMSTLSRFGADELAVDIIKAYGIPAAGFIIGVLWPTGTLQKIPSCVIAPVSSIAMGDSIFTKSAGVVDELLISRDYTGNHYLTFAVIGKKTADLWTDNEIISYLGVLLGTAFAYFYEEKFVEKFQSAARMHERAYEVYSKVLPKQYLDLQTENYDLFSMGDKLLEQIIVVNILKHFQGVKHGFEHQDWVELNGELLKMGVFLVILVVDKVVSINGDNYFNEDLHFALSDQVHPKLVSSNIVNYPNSTVLTESSISDIETLVPATSSLRSGAISSLLKGAYGFGMMVKTGSPVIPIYAFLYSQGDAYFTEKIISKRAEYLKEGRRLESERNSIIKHDAKNIRIIMERDGLETTEEKIRQIGIKLKENEKWQNRYYAIAKSYRTLFGWLDYLASFGLAASEIRKDSSLFEDRANLQESSWQILAFFSWFKDSAETVASIEAPINNTATLVDLICRPTSDNDQIERITRDGNELILENVEIGYGEKTLVSIDELSFEMGKIYAITGESGCGKSTLLSKIKGVKEENGAFGKGDIYYPIIDGGYPKIAMISQQDYFPIDSSLEEIIYYPNEVSINRQEIEGLLRKFGIRGFDGSDQVCTDLEKELTLDSKDDWYKELSGGEKKKISIISAIIKKPDILILDEIFSAFDHDTMRIAQELIKEYLPGSLILIVDHQARNNNHDGFYSGGELHFSDKKIILQKI